VGAPGFGNGDERRRVRVEAPRGMGCGERVSPSPIVERYVEGAAHVPLLQKNFRFWISNRRILVQTGCFLYSSPKAGLNAMPTFKITLGTSFSSVPAGNDPWSYVAQAAELVGTEGLHFWHLWGTECRRCSPCFRLQT